MDITDEFTFGRYEGFTISSVFKGTHEINRDLLQDYLINCYKFADQHDAVGDILIRDCHLEISKTIIRVHPSDPRWKTLNWSSYIQKFFGSGNDYFYRLAKRSLEDFSQSHFKEGKEKILLGGDPQYIAWCIKDLEDFYIEPYQIVDLEKMEVNYFHGIIVKFKTEDIYEYQPEIERMKYKFTDEILRMNLIKANRAKRKQ